MLLFWLNHRFDDLGVMRPFKVSNTFTFTFRSFSRHFYLKPLTISRFVIRIGTKYIAVGVGVRVV